ncbi:unnamed protein product [Closterium sp. NIES-53]
MGGWIAPHHMQAHFAKSRIELNLKYIDPTYMIRAVPANASDNIYCTLLAHSAIHGSMAGFTGFTVGPINGRHAYIPIKCVSEKSNTVSLTDRMGFEAGNGSRGGSEGRNARMCAHLLPTLDPASPPARLKGGGEGSGEEGRERAWGKGELEGGERLYECPSAATTGSCTCINLLEVGGTGKSREREKEAGRLE